VNPAGRKLIFDAAKRRGAVFKTMADVRDMDAAIDAALLESDLVPVVVEPEPAPPLVSHIALTARVALEIIGHEAIVREAYKDSVGVWTWAIGVTNKSGHTVYPRYKDNPQTIEHCVEVYLWLLRAKYIPDVVRAFDGFLLTEAQFAAALSFHYNTGAILKAEWVRKVKAGDLAGARTAIMNYRRPPEIVGRREKERDLFFDGKWSQDGLVTVYPVRKPSYTPDWRHPARVDISAAVAAGIHA
jgi:lysozyme